MIEVNQLYHEYKKSEAHFYALKNINLTIKPAEHIAVLGRNGCGKSTLAKHLNALLLPTTGTVRVDGMDTQDEDQVLSIRQQVGMVFQNPDNQLVATTVIEDVAFGPENLGLSPALIKERVHEALRLVHMKGYENHAPSCLSGGQKQRIAIAGVIAMRPKYIVFDEPTAMLDPQGRKEVISTMLRLREEESIAIINITHFMDEAVLADRVLVMDDGDVVMQGTPREIFSQIDILKSLHLDVPVVTELALALHEQLPHIPKNTLTIKEMVNALCP